MPVKIRCIKPETSKSKALPVHLLPLEHSSSIRSSIHPLREEEEEASSQSDFTINHDTYLVSISSGGLRRGRYSGRNKHKWGKKKKSRVK